MENVKEFLKNLLNTNDIVVVATSGGPDSMFLLHSLNNLKNEYNLKIICAHVNHNIRKESEEEKKFVEKYCVDNNIIFEYFKIEEYPDNKFSEEKARKIRYSFFDQIVKKYNAKYLFTAHHGDDLIETILMRIKRGSNLKGYIGIPKISSNKNYKIVRPLLYISKEEILEYLSSNNIEYVTDISNTSEKYTRNRFRKHVLPELKKEDNNIHKKFLIFSEELEDNLKYIDTIVKEKYSKIVKNNIIDISLLKKEDKFIQKKLVEKVIENIQKDYIFDVNKKNLEDILKLIDTDNKKIDLKNGFIARKSYNSLIIAKNNKVNDYEYELDSHLIILNKYCFNIVNVSNLKNNNVIRINSKDIKMPLIIRNRKSGDKIKIKNLNGTQKIKDVFINSKLDKEKRDEYPLLVDSNNNILWIPGMKKSIFDKDISEKYDIIIEYTEGNYE